MNYCRCGHQAKIRCTSCGSFACGMHSGPAPSNSNELRVGMTEMICSSCIERAEEARRLAVEGSVLKRTDTLQIVAALSTEDGLTDQGFGHYRSLGVAFKTGSPWDEVMNLYREYPIDAGSTHYYLWVRTTTMFGSKATCHNIGSVPGVPVSLRNSEGYSVGEGRVTANGRLLHNSPSFNTHKLFLTSDSSSPWTGSGVGFNPFAALLAVNEHRKVIDRYTQEHSSLFYSEEEAKAFLVPIFGQWKLHTRGVDIPEDIKISRR